MQILVVEDDVFTLQNLIEGLEEYGYSNISSAVNSGEAIKRFIESVPDLLIVDINLGSSGSSGIDLVAKLNPTGELPVIYVTGEMDMLTVQRALHTRPSNYLLKPIDIKELSISIELALINYSKNQVAEKPDASTATKVLADSIIQKSETIFIKKKGRFTKMGLCDILWIDADNVYIDIHYTSNSVDTLAISLKRFEEQVVASNMVRVNRSQIVNMDHIDSFESHRAFIRNTEFKITDKYKDAFFLSIR